MTRKRSLSTMVLIGCILTLSVAMQGCGNKETEKAKEAAERKDFRGGPMPPEAQKIFAEKMAAMNKNNSTPAPKQ